MTNSEKISKAYNLIKDSFCSGCREECEICSIRLIKQYAESFEKEQKKWESQEQRRTNKDNTI